ncbi:MAG: hypothetical protein IPM79_19795 [Polyangiaceae bacterium]|nr:hypothetical protein [Polyangiaceae bacterium]
MGAPAASTDGPASPFCEHLLLAVLVALARSAEVAARGPRSLTPEAEADVLRAAEAVTELTETRQRQRCP